MSLFDDASLVYIPTGYKPTKNYSGKPSTGGADMTFSRASGATRVNSRGLVEKVRTNLLLQSNSFDTTWTTLNGASVTSGQTGYDGSSDAWLLDRSNFNAHVNQTISLSAVGTFSVYAKAGTLNWMRLRDNNGVGAYFDLSGSGAVGSTSGLIDSAIESIGGGWFRCSVVANWSSSSFKIYQADANGDTSGTSGNIYIQDAQLETGDIATNYIETTSAAVSVGPVNDEPRLTYDPVNPTAPSLLMEPQRTNLVTFSEQMDNAAWTKTNVTITANDEVSPDGYTNADKITDNATNTQHRVSQTISVTSGTSYTASIFVKNDDKGDFAINFTASGFSSTQIVFNLINGTVTSGTGTIQDYGNGWYRISATEAANVTGSGTIGFNLGNGGSYVGSSQSVFIYGAQLESSASYPTSYIPTNGTSVTRVADAASKTGISSLIGQTEGVLFYDFVWGGAISATADYPIVLSGSDFNNFVGLNTTFNSNQLLAYSGGSIVAAIAGADFVIGQRYKIALAYKANDFVYYVNGTLQGSDTSGAVPIGLANFQMVTPFGSKSTAQNANSILFFPTRLSNATLATLTSL
jgi:hypothetical protein